MTYFEVFDKHLSKELARQAKEAMECDRRNPSEFVGDRNFLKSSIAGAFCWDTTEQGFEFWDEVNRRYDRVPV